MWIARVSLNAYRSEGDTGKLAFRISPDDTITAETGNTHLERVGRIVVTKRIFDFKPGDTLIATECAGEEDYQIWYKGKVFSIPVFWKTVYSPEEEDYDAEEQKDTSKISGIMFSRPLMIWWVKIKNNHDDTGWLRLVNKTLYCFELEERIDGMDGCD